MSRLTHHIEQFTITIKDSLEHKYYTNNQRAFILPPYIFYVTYFDDITSIMMFLYILM